MWFVISSDHIHKSVLDSTFYEMKSRVHCQVRLGLGQHVKHQIVALTWLSSAQLRPFPALAHLLPECWFTRVPYATPTLSSAPLFALFPQNISESQVLLPTTDITRSSWLMNGTQRDFQEGSCVRSFSSEFCLSTLGLTLYMCLTFLRTRNLQGCYPLSKRGKKGNVFQCKTTRECISLHPAILIFSRIGERKCRGSITKSNSFDAIGYI